MSQSAPPDEDSLDRAKIWAFFKYCYPVDEVGHVNGNISAENDNDSQATANVLICILCNERLCNTSSSMIIANGKTSASTALRSATISASRVSSTPSYTYLLNHIKSEHQQIYLKLHNDNNNNINPKSSHCQARGQIDNHNNRSEDESPKSIKSTGTIVTSTIMTKSNPRRELKNQRLNLDFIDYNDLSFTSFKPSPSSSLSRNLMSRLNQLSSPVTRKLKFWNKKSFQVNQYDPSSKVIYLGNLAMQFWSKDESCLDKPLGTLWNNYLVNMKTEIVMRLTICNSGLKAITRQHGLTQYWSNRLVYCCSHENYPKIFSWIYRHEGKKMRQELRCHAVLCSSSEKAAKMVTMLNQRLACALQEFKREKRSRGVTLIDNLGPSQPRMIPLRRQILAKGSANFRPPLERSKSAPKLTSILEEDYDSDSNQSGQISACNSQIDDEDNRAENCDNLVQATRYEVNRCSPSSRRSASNRLDKNFSIDEQSRADPTQSPADEQVNGIVQRLERSLESPSLKSIQMCTGGKSINCAQNELLTSEIIKSNGRSPSQLVQSDVSNLTDSEPNMSIGLRATSSSDRHNHYLSGRDETNVKDITDMQDRGAKYEEWSDGALASEKCPSIVDRQPVDISDDIISPWSNFVIK